MDRLQFLIDWYNREEERKASVENSLNIPIGILTILFAMQFFLIKEFDFANCENWERFALVLNIILSTFAALGAGLYVFKSYHNFPKAYKYGGIPYPSQLLNYEKDLIKFYRENAEHFENVDGKEKFKDYLQAKLAEHLDTNTFNNDEKYRFLNIAKTLIFLAVITLLIAFFPFLTNFFSRPDKPLQIEIVNLRPLNERVERLEDAMNLNHPKNDDQRKTPGTDTTTSTTR